MISLKSMDLVSFRDTREARQRHNKVQQTVACCSSQVPQQSTRMVALSKLSRGHFSETANFQAAGPCDVSNPKYLKKQYQACWVRAPECLDSPLGGQSSDGQEIDTINIACRPSCIGQRAGQQSRLCQRCITEYGRGKAGVTVQCCLPPPLVSAPQDTTHATLSD